ncbi:MAG TPA: magnesium transporter [Blastocatellia bacterium]|nr:magnesium transporter [Blastocatellia bacterium]
MAYPRKLDLAIESTRKLARIGASVNLVNLLRKMRPEDVAVIFGNLTDGERLFAFRSLLKQDGDFVAQTISAMPPKEGAALLAHLEPVAIADLLQKLPVDDATELTSKLPPELAEQVLEVMNVARSADVVDQLQFEENTAGRIMNPNVFALHEDMSVGEAITTLQRKSDELEMVFYLYVIDDRHHLVGVVSLRQLLLNPPSTPLRKIMSTDVISVHTSTDQEEVARVVSKYDLLAVPVVDDENRLVGIITVDDVIDVLREEATEDIYALAGVDTDEKVTTPSLRSIQLRFPWLFANLLTAILAAGVVYLFQDTISKVVAAATLMTIVAGQGGNAAIQTITVIVRGLALGEVTWANARRVLFKEILVGTGNGLLIGGIMAVVALFWFKKPMLGVAIGLALIINLFVAGLFGTLIPLFLRWLKLDPALASGVIVTTFTDVCGFFSFLGLVTLLLNWMQ